MTVQTQDYMAFDKLRDDRTVCVRAIRPDDKALLQEGMQHLSPQSLYFRFFTHKENLTDKELAYFTEVDFNDHVALLAGFYENGEMSPAAIGRYIVDQDELSARTAELAVTVAEEYQGLGFASILLRHLVQIAKASGITRLRGVVLPENKKMLNLITRSGLPCTRTLDDTGEWEITMHLA